MRARMAANMGAAFAEALAEPATLGLLAVGGLGVLLRRRRNILIAGFAILLIGLLAVPSFASYPEIREYLLGDIDGFVYCSTCGSRV